MDENRVQYEPTNQKNPLATSALARSSINQLDSIVKRQTHSLNRQRTRIPALTKTTDSTLSSDLSLKITGDVGVAAGVTFAVSPFIVAIDKAVVQKAAGTHTISRSIVESMTNMMRNPVSFIKSPTFLMMWGVYCATYTTANCCKTLMEHRGKIGDNQSKLSPTSDNSRAQFGVFVGTTAVNSAASMMKDRFYATKFGASSAPAKVPLITYGLWGLRDCMVIGSSFVLPDIVSGVVEKEFDVKKATALQISQFICPIATQAVVTPVQLLGLDFYNRPLASATDRFQFQCTNFVSIFAARILRIAPAYSIGGIGNTYFRNEWRDYLLRREVVQEQSMFENTSPSYCTA